MARYHISPGLGPRKCSARFQCEFAAQGKEVEHYDSKAEADKAWSAELAKKNAHKDGTDPKGDFRKSKTQSVAKNDDPERDSEDLRLEAIAERIRNEAPDVVDTAAEAVYERWALARRDRDAFLIQAKSYDDYADKYGRSTEWGQSYEKRREEALEKADAASDKVAEISRELAVYNKEYNRRPWPRAFLVNNGNGHVHKDMNCSTCYETTEYRWMTQFSGKTEKEIVDAAGERACTVCYPSAESSGALKRQTQMFTKDEERKAEERIERERKRAEREKKAKENGIFNEDGTPLRIKFGDRYANTYKTERAARIEMHDRMESLQRIEDRLAKETTPGDEQYFSQYHVETKFYIDEISKAIARKTGQTPEEVLAEAREKLIKNKRMHE